MSYSDAKKYLRTQISTAAPEQLLLMLYDGAIRFLFQAQEAVKAEDHFKTHENLIKVQRILIELICSLRQDVDPDLSRNLTSLYHYIYRQLIQANIDKDVEKINESIDLLSTLRSGWREAVETLRGNRPQTGTSPSSGISLQG